MRFAIALVALFAALPATAQTWCHPKDSTARILQSHNPNDLHPQWTGESYIGTGWALAPGQRVTVDGVDYIKGTLYSPRGGVVNEDVYVLTREWDCG